MEKLHQTKEKQSVPPQENLAETVTRLRTELEKLSYLFSVVRQQRDDAMNGLAVVQAELHELRVGNKKMNGS